MSNVETTASLRISCDADDVSRLTAGGAYVALEALGKISKNKDATVLVVDLDLDPRSGLDQALDKPGAGPAPGWSSAARATARRHARHRRSSPRRADCSRPWRP